MQLQLSRRLQAFIDEQVASGDYSSPEEVVQAAIELFAMSHPSGGTPAHLTPGPPLSIDQLQTLIEEGIASAEAGELYPFDPEDIKRRGQERLAAKRGGGQ